MKDSQRYTRKEINIEINKPIIKSNQKNRETQK